MKPTQEQVDYYIYQRSHTFACRLIIFGFAGLVAGVLKLGGWVDWSWTWTLFPWWFGWIYTGTWFAGMLIYRVTVEVEERKIQ